MKAFDRAVKTVFKAEIGDYIKPDGWKWNSKLQEGFAWRDESLRNWEFNVMSPTLNDVWHCMNVTITSRCGRYTPRGFELRCKIEFIQEGKEPVYSGGVIYR